jgi:uncharacterized membrane protein YhhN
LLSNPSIAFVLITGLGVAAALAFTRAGMSRAYALSKAIASLGFIGTALTAGATDAAWSRLALGALVLSAAGDVALAVRGRKGFLIGLACFAVAHSVYAVAFGLYGTRGAILGVTASVAALVAGGAWLSLNHRLPGPMRVPVGVYLVIVTAMLTAGTAAGITHRAWLLACGVLLVAGSDIAVGRERFGKSMFANKLLGLPTYYAGQTLIALSLAGP